MSSYTLVEIELAKPLPRVQLAATENGVGLIIRAHSRPVGFLLRQFPPESVLLPERFGELIRESIPSERIQLALSRKSLGANLSQQMPPLTIAICTKDHPDQLARCLKSLVAVQNRHSCVAEACEILVIDNGSKTARTLQVSRQFHAEYVCEPKPGLDFARNAALAAGSGEIIAFIDDDVVVDHGWLAGLAEAWQTDPNAGAFTGQVLPLALQTHAQVLTEELGGFRKGFEARRYEPCSHTDPLYPCTTIFGNGCNMAFNRRIALALGGFDEALDRGKPLPGGGDLDMLYRVVRAGYSLVYEPSFLVFHEHRGTYRQLRSQVCRSWGLGCMAFLVKTARQDREQGWKAERFIRWWFHDMIARLRNGVFGRGPWPLDLALAEFWGALLGFCGGYRRSQRRIARLRRRDS